VTRAFLPAVAAAATAITIAACGTSAKKPAPPPPARAIASSGCSPITYGGAGRPQFLIAASTALQGQVKEHGVQIAQALKLVLAQHGWKAGPYRIGLQICDETTAKSDYADPNKCAANARAFTRNRSVLAVVGPHFSSCAASMLGILSKAPGGAIPVISGSTTYLGLTRSGPGVGPGEPASFYDGGARNFVRIVPADDVQGAAMATYLKDHGTQRAYVLTDKDPYGIGIGDAFSFAARKLGITLAGSAQWNAKAKDYRALARRVAGTHPDAVLTAGYVFDNAPQLIKDLRAALPTAQLMGPDGMNQPSAIVEVARDSAENLLLTIALVPARALPPAGRAFAQEFRRRYSQYPCCFSVNAAQAAQLVLDAIARSDGSRAKVMAALFQADVKGGLIGDFKIDRYGDTTLTKMGLFRIKDGEGRFEGTISPRADLLARR
jgi:branched-chain amino acid transport system substrate-binding protein